MFDEKFDDTKGVIRRRTNSTMARVNRTTKKLKNKNYTGNERLSNMNPTKENGVNSGSPKE
jgi:hypothetical protein